MKRFIYILLCLVLITTALPFNAFPKAEPGTVPEQSNMPDAEPTDEPSADISFQPIDEPTAKPIAEPHQEAAQSLLPTMDPENDPFEDISTPHLLLMEAESGAVLYERSGYEKAFPASTTKIMTAIVAIENLSDLSRAISIDWHYLLGFGETSSMMGLEAGEEIALIDILHGLMMRSGNDAAKTLAAETVFELDGIDENADKHEAVKAAVEKFVNLMNEKAAELGMNATHFATVDGRHNEEHYTSAYDFALLMRYALKNPLLKKIMSTATYDIKPNNKHRDGYHLENSNKLICKKAQDKESFRYKYCIAGKTGETNAAGFCLATAAAKNDVTLILIQFGDNNSSISGTYRYKTAPQIYEWGFANYGCYPVSAFDVAGEFMVQAAEYSPYDENYGKFPVKADTEALFVGGITAYLDKIKANPSVVRTELKLNDLTAPIKKGGIIGNVEYYFYDYTPVTAALIAQRDVAAVYQYTPEPYETAFITDTPPPGNDKNCNLNLLRSPGENRYSVWIYYKNSLYTMDSTEWHYLYCDKTVFRACASAEHAGNICLYKRLFDSSDKPYYKLVDAVSENGAYLIVSDGKALSANSHSGSLAAVEVNINDTGVITQEMDEKTVWNFEVSCNGYHVMNSSKYLSRSAGSGVLLWIIAVILLLFAAICIHLLTGERSRRSRRRRKRNKTARYHVKRQI